MVNLTRADLEDIWNNKPYGYFTQMSKKWSKHKPKKFVVKIRPYLCQSLDGYKETVIAYNQNDIEIFNARKKLSEWADKTYKHLITNNTITIDYKYDIELEY